ncbi:MAG: RagB/SusD family nutrient uptake outer membrane protein [Acidobacterium ailaaui]|uniref:RagB/SusD family nutrient uptake outer membrane protein n=1 Tax=Thermoflavifilum sp. TaxID=1968839 RepID=UPI0018A692A7|nr:RagB/SusD family nutrient uptake outer membrane protein [Thermoflavifilum sp.]MBX6361597.1 RagB/SusD family nutrient uptake outer membrane protein [Pseudacidobacterium ailaaui]QOR75752.1 MAG: RagB/SusD family nutrient uptake outer membrane protein [Thermoflavifilum sp.]
MKRKDFITSIARLALLTPIISGCKKVLIEPVLGSYQSNNFFTNDQNAVLAINAAYTPLTFTDASSNAIWVLGDVASDDAIKGGLPGDQADFELVDQFNINPSNSAIEAVWKRFYDGVFRCNVVLDGLPPNNSLVSLNVKNSCIGQAKFLRAYYYFVLTNCFGDIPLHLTVGTPEEQQIPASPREQVFAQIEQDCLDAIHLLPTSWGEADLGRATKGAAMSLLAKVYLFQQKWDLAAQTAQAVEDLGIYSLLPKFNDNFNANYKNNPEAIFSVWHVSGASPFQGNSLNQWFAPRPLNGYGFFYPTQSLVDNFEISPSGVPDPRLDYTIARKGHPYFDVPFDPEWTTTGYLCKKHCQPLSEIPPNIKGDGNLNYVAIRFADILLVKAEALNEMGNSQAALIPLNKIRKRARESYLYDPSLPGYGTVPSDLLPDIKTTDQQQLRDIIRRERRSELALEFHRFFDIIRYGKNYAMNAMKDIPNFNYDTDKFFPIPQSERDTNKKLDIH